MLAGAVAAAGIGLAGVELGAGAGVGVSASEGIAVACAGSVPAAAGTPELLLPQPASVAVIRTAVSSPTGPERRSTNITTNSARVGYLHGSECGRPRWVVGPTRSLGRVGARRRFS